MHRGIVTRLRLVLVGLALSASCAPTPGQLVVQVSTDLTPLVQFDEILVEAPAGATAERLPARSAAGYGRGVRALVREGVAEGPVRLRVSLALNGVEVAYAERIARVSGPTTVITLRVTRDCVGVVCDTVLAPACLVGACVAAECTPETPDACPPGECGPTAGGVSCAASAIACVDTTCSLEGVCVLDPHDERCPPLSVCDPTRGCVASAPCDPTAAFGAPVPFPPSINSPSDETGAFLSADGRRLYFASTQTTLGALFVSERPNATDAWGPPVLLGSLDSESREDDPTLSPDERTIYFDSARDGTRHLFAATRASLGAPFGAPVRVEALTSGAEDVAPWIGATGESLYFTSARGTTYDIFRAARDGDVFSPPTVVRGLDTAWPEDQAVLTADELHVLFSSSEVRGAQDLWAGTRATVDDAFVTRLVPELTTSERDYAVWLSADGCTVIIQNTTSGNGDLFLAERAR